MDEIIELQRRLAAAQASTTASRLSERNCIELVMKLQSLSLINLIFTRSGREYLTPAQLRCEIQDEIFVRGGRVNIIDLPDALNVDLSHVHTALPEVIADAPCPTRVVNGEIVTDEYLVALAADVDISLKQSPTGLDSVGNIATRTNLPVEIVRDCVRKHVGTIIRASLDDATGMLRSYTSRNRALVAARGALRGVTSPTLLADLATRHDVPADIMSEACAELLETKRMRGRVEGHGARALFAPAIFESAARSAALSTFATAGFVTAEKLRALYLSDPETFAAKSLPDAVCLGNVFIGPSLFETVQSSAVEAIAAGSWLDIGAALPPDFPSSAICHIVELLDHSGQKPNTGSFTAATGARSAKGVKRKGGKTTGSGDGSGEVSSKEDANPSSVINAVKLDAPILQSQFLVSQPLLQSCAKRVRRDAEERAKVRATHLADMMTVVGAKPLPSWATGQPDDDEDGDGKKTGKLKPRRRKEKKIGGNESGMRKGDSRIGAPLVVPSVDDIVELLTHDDSLSDGFSADYLGNPPNDISDLLLAIVTEAVGGADGLTSLYEAEAAAAVVELEKVRAAAGLRLAKQIVANLDRADFFEQTADSLAVVSPELPNASRAYVMETSCLSTTLHVLDLLASNLGLPGSGSTSPSDKSRTSQAIQDISKRLPPDVSSKIRRLVAASSAKNMESITSYLEAYDECSESLDLPARRPLDKKRERGVAAALSAEYAGMISDGSAALHSMPSIEALRIAVVLLFARCSKGNMIALAPAFLLPVCTWIEENTNLAGLAVALSQFRSAVTSGLHPRSDDVESARPPTMQDDNLLQHLANVRQYFTPA